MAHRDAHLWELQSLLDGAFHVIGALSAANRRYFSSFQFKRMREHVSGLQAAPPRLAERLESLFELERPAAARELGLLAAETVEVVERRLRPQRPHEQRTFICRRIQAGGLRQPPQLVNHPAPVDR
jgi:hypothetical protein